MDVNADRRRFRRQTLAILFILGGLAGAVGWLLGREPRPGPGATLVTTRPIPSSPFLNTRTDVAYVGDESCAGCHGDIARVYSEHPMARSMSLAAPTNVPEFDGKAPAVFAAQGFDYSVSLNGDNLVHAESRRDASGDAAAVHEEVIRYIVGSGSQGKSYLVERDGRLVQSPISWYSAEKRWDLSPGYRNKNHHFERTIRSSCLFCHANRHDAVEGTINSYRSPIFHGLGIGCERCHGPGSLHVASAGSAKTGLDPTIVNPGRLEPALREAVCEQCHVIGKSRVERIGRSLDAYRPGLPLEEFVRVFVDASDIADPHAEVGQVEQMRASRCYQDSSGKLGCISCHDPHRTPSDAERVAHYRKRCLACHESQGCKLPVDERTSSAGVDDCIACHMPSSGLKNIAHSAATDHRIVRRLTPDSALADDPSPRRGPPRLSPLHAPEKNEEARLELARDRAIAEILLAYNDPSRMDRPSLLQSQGALRAAVSARPEDIAAHEALGVAYTLLEREIEALEAFRAVLRLDPRRELALAGIAPTAALHGKPGEGVGAIRHAIDLNPWSSQYRLTLANLLALTKDWGGAAAAYREAVRLDPMNLNARRGLVRCAVATGDVAAVREECRKLLAFDPPDAAIFRRLVEQVRAR